MAARHCRIPLTRSKPKSAAIFRAAWEAVKADPEYQRMMAEHKAKYG